MNINAQALDASFDALNSCAQCILDQLASCEDNYAVVMAEYIPVFLEKLIEFTAIMEKSYGSAAAEGDEIIQALSNVCSCAAVEKTLDRNGFIDYFKTDMLHLDIWFHTNAPASAYRLSITAIVRNEADIEEWIEYHLMAGVEHFYIYDNESTDDLKTRLQKYIDKGLVTYTYYPGECVQEKAYANSIGLHKYDTKWMALIDGDEFIVPVEDKPLPVILDEIVHQHYRKKWRSWYFIGGIGVNWRIYGTSFHDTRQNGGGY